jgi:hypothetical protein
MPIFDPSKRKSIEDRAKDEADDKADGDVAMADADSKAVAPSDNESEDDRPLADVARSKEKGEKVEKKPKIKKEKSKDDGGGGGSKSASKYWKELTKQLEFLSNKIAVALDWCCLPLSSPPDRFGCR